MTAPIAIYRGAISCPCDKNAAVISEKRVTEFLERRRWELRGPGEGCLVWTGSRTKFGHGRFRVGDRILKAHRVAYAIAYGKCPAEVVLLHTCDNPACVAICHLQQGTVADNNADMRAKGRAKRPPVHSGISHPMARKVRFRGRTRCLADWAREQGIKASTVRKRLARGWSIARTLTERASK